jgi:hypothetical protein
MPNRGGFSWKRAVGVTRAKQRISRRTGIPLTRSGRERKIGRTVTGGGCLIPGLLLVVVTACAGGSRLDPSGGSGMLQPRRVILGRAPRRL